MWTEAFAGIGAIAGMFAVMTIYYHLKGAITGTPDFHIERSWLFMSYLAVVVVVLLGMQDRPSPCPKTGKDPMDGPYDYLDEEERTFIR